MRFGEENHYDEVSGVLKALSALGLWKAAEIVWWLLSNVTVTF